MGRHRKVDLTSPPATIRLLIAALLILLTSLPAAAQEAADADQLFTAGMAAAKQQNWQEAHDTFLKGHRLFPNDARFPTELGGVEFQQKNFYEALEWLKIARRLKPEDAYVHDFMGSVYYITGNRYAAINEWNRAGKPVLASVRTEPTPRLDPVILDRAFAFAPGDKLTTSKLLTTEARLRALNVFAKADFYIAARPDGKFDATLYDDERHGFGRNKWEILLSLLGGLPGYAFSPTYYNVNGTGTNLAAFVRFDAEKRRYSGNISGPIRRNPRWRYRVGGDFRNENWNVRNFSDLPGTQLGSLNIRRSAASVDIDSIESGRWNWSVGGEYSYRDFRSVIGALGVPGLLLQGSQLKQRAQINYEILRLPEHHLLVSSNATTQLGRLWDDGGSHTFFKSQGSITADWAWNRAGDDWQTQQRVSVGGTEGDPPFDELFQLGLDRDNTDLKLRAHIGTDKRRKGNAPLGRNYLLANWELDKKAYSNGLFSVTLGPFLDSGKITDPLDFLGSTKWLTDTGAQAKFKAFGMQLVVVYGKNLRNGDNVGYVYFTR